MKLSRSHRCSIYDSYILLQQNHLPFHLLLSSGLAGRLKTHLLRPARTKEELRRVSGRAQFQSGNHSVALCCQHGIDENKDAAG